jgi:hypothetical protein
MFVLFYAFFLAFFLFILSVSPFAGIVSTSANMTLSAPTCTFTSWFVLFDIIYCGAAYFVYFFTFMTVSIAVGYGWLWLLVFSPLLITLGWLIVEVLRGTS